MHSLSAHPVVVLYFKCVTLTFSSFGKCCKIQTECGINRIIFLYVDTTYLAVNGDTGDG